jgi:lysozyme
VRRKKEKRRRGKMIDKKKLTLQLIQEEDIKLLPYNDVYGNLTIGIGRNLTEVGITEDEAYYLCNNDIDSHYKDLQKRLPYFNSLPENVQYVLTDMCFNLGIGNLLTFHKTLNLIKAGEYKLAADEMLKSLWSKQVGQRAINLSNMLKSTNI